MHTSTTNGNVFYIAHNGKSVLECLIVPQHSGVEVTCYLDNVLQYKNQHNYPIKVAKANFRYFCRKYGFDK